MEAKAALGDHARVALGERRDDGSKWYVEGILARGSSGGGGAQNINLLPGPGCAAPSSCEPAADASVDAAPSPDAPRRLAEHVSASVSAADADADAERSALEGEIRGLERQLGAVRASGSRDPLRIIHFNDVYNVTEREQEPCGGAARFKGLLQQVSADGGDGDALVLFSGDAFAPSVMSTVLKGVQMPPVLNELGINAACVGNHDFDFGVEKMAKLISATNFPWLLSNARLADEGASRLLQRTVVLEKGGYRVGLMGLVEKEWVDTLALVDPEDITVSDPVTTGSAIAAELRSSGCDVVIALTHMRMANDERLQRESTGIDLILGGHDHDYVVSPGARGTSEPSAFKSGTDFRDMSVIRAVPKAEGGRLAPGGDEARLESGGLALAYERKRVTREAPADARVAAIVASFGEEITRRMDRVIGHCNVSLDARFATIRSHEAAVGNLVADIMRDCARCDIAFLNSGTLRADAVIPSGDFKLGTLMALLPMADPMLVVSLSAGKLLEVLENSVCKWPRLEGRFLQVSGVSFAFDAQEEPGRRVRRDSVRVGGEPLDAGRSYTAVTKEYLFMNRDGFTFGDAEVLVAAENLPPVNAAVRNYFTILEQMGSMKRRDSTIRRASVRLLQGIEERKAAGLSPMKAGGDRFGIQPTVEGRITIVQ